MTPVGLWVAGKPKAMAYCAKMTRRKFLTIAASASAAGAMTSCGGTRSPWRFFTLQEAQTLEAICERIIPADQEPGAKWAGVVTYIDRQLTGHYKKLRKTYRLGIEGVGQTSRNLFGKRFEQLSGEQQDAVLRSLEKGQAPGENWTLHSSQEFFALVVNHSMQGFYGDPRHGGNRDGVSWKMLGLTYPPIRGRVLYDVRNQKTGVRRQESEDRSEKSEARSQK